MKVNIEAWLHKNLYKDKPLPTNLQRLTELYYKNKESFQVHEVGNIVEVEGFAYDHGGINEIESYELTRFGGILYGFFIIEPKIVDFIMAQIKQEHSRVHNNKFSMQAFDKDFTL